MKDITAEIEIEAPAAKVWQILTDFHSYPQWNPFIRKVQGSCAAGKRLRIEVQPPGRNGTKYRAAVTAVKENEELRWRRRWLVPFLFDRVHVFTIAPAAEGRVILVQREIFRGIVPLFLRGTDAVMLRGFLDMNYELKMRAEKETLGE